MDRLIRSLVLVISLLVAGSVFADWIEDSDKNAMVVLRSQAAFQPESIARAGLSEFDGDVFDLNANYTERQDANDRGLLVEMKKRLAAETHPKVKQDLEILIRSLNDEIETRRIDNKYMLPYFNIHRAMFGSFNALLDPRNDRERYVKALERLRKYNGSEDGFTRVTELAKARSRERFDVAGLAGPYKGELEKDLSDAPRYIAGVKAMFERVDLAGWQDEFSKLEDQLTEYSEWVSEEMLPRARQNNQLPAEVYANNLKNFGVRATPEELIAEAQYGYQFIRSEMKALAFRIAEDRGWEDKRLVPVMRKLKAEQIPQDEILEVYKGRLAQIEDIIRRENIITLPERDASIRLATEAESAAVPAPFMSPPQLINNTGQYGEFVLVQTNPSLEGDAIMDDWSHDAITWALTVHEARPGHELQFASLVENGTSLARALFAFNSANAEGWGLYAEAIMHEYLPQEAQLFNLFTRLMRAARMFMDPMINTGQLTPEQAVDFMVEQTALSLPMATSEADRYSFLMPGQATSYYFGYMNLMRLRTEVEVVLGNDFDQREFHDYILEQGLLPPDLLREAVLERFVQ
ncbi:MAG: DUF885 domain-containing protein [Gammaproteobacteria bacterium]|nr:MAG: DUF885 domain-containing protein [Gammaproteobacteria bacterium]